MILKSPLSYSFWDNPPDEQALQLKPKSENKQPELWLAVHLPRLALETVARENYSLPLVIIEEINSRQFVHIASHAAEQLGIVSGMSLTAAYTLCSNLQTQPVNPLAQQQRLQRLANWVLQFSPRICLAPPCVLPARGSMPTS